jgi:hypothetical protein
MLALGVLSLVLLALLLARGMNGRYITTYPFFYAYVGGWLLAGLIRFFFFTFHLSHPDEYTLVYWYTQFLLVAGGYAVVWQIYAHTLKDYAGTARMARHLVSLIYATILFEFIGKLFSGQADELISSVIRLERNLQSVQAVLLILFVMLVGYYGIPLGRNVQGLVVGYGLFVGTRLITLTLREVLGTPFYSWWYYSEPICVLATLLVWSLALRSYQPNPVPDRSIEIERDYKLATRRTAEAIATARGYLARALIQ